MEAHASGTQESVRWFSARAEGSRWTLLACSPASPMAEIELPGATASAAAVRCIDLVTGARVEATRVGDRLRLAAAVVAEGPVLVQEVTLPPTALTA